MVRINVEDQKDTVWKLNGIKPFNEEMTFYYDESGNCRKFYLTDNGFNDPEAIKGDFVLAGIAHNGKSYEIDLVSLHEALEYKEGQKELKFKHLYHNSADFVSFMGSKRATEFLEWLDKSGLYIHYSALNNLFYSLVDIVDSLWETHPMCIMYFWDIKNALYDFTIEHQDEVIDILIRHTYPDVKDTVSFCYELCDLISKYSATSKFGKKIISDNSNLANLIAKYVKGYNVIFELPTKWDRTSQKSITDPNFLPLLKNQDGEVVSYIGYSENSGYELLLPFCEKKDELIERLVTSVLPEILPDFFPESKEFEWIKEQDFLPKEILELEKERTLIQEQYNSKIKSLNERRNAIDQKYKFLNDLLIETGDKLVQAVCTYFKWLGFANVEAIDGNEDILREDIQILEDDKLFIIEVKGIGGTSTDAECSQVAKHRRRREKEHRDKEILPIYIVNHQRYIRPSLRQNPPFSDNQIDYAKNDERGLLTTWQLYNQYKLIENGIFTKKETRESLDKWGLISLLPKNLIRVGIYEEYFKKPKAGILTLNNVKLEVGKMIYAKKDGKWICTSIVSIQLNDKDVDQVDNGEVGIVTDIELEKGYEIFVKIE